MGQQQTANEYKEVIRVCKELFEKKTRDYGTAWRILRLSSLTDQIFIKAQRVRSIQEKGKQRVSDPVQDEFIGIINYAVMALMQIQLPEGTPHELSFEELEPLYDQITESIWNLLDSKNHDYGEAWRDMRVSSMTDLILMKILRIKQIEDNQGQTLVSEGIDANYMDIVNYAVFCMIKLTTEE